MINKEAVSKIGVVTVAGATYMGNIKVTATKLEIKDAYPIEAEGKKTVVITKQKASVYFRKFNKDELDQVVINNPQSFITRKLRNEETTILENALVVMERAIDYKDADAVNAYFSQLLG